MSMASGESAWAAATHLAVAPLRVPSWCSAMMRTLDICVLRIRHSRERGSPVSLRLECKSLDSRVRGNDVGLQQPFFLQCRNQLGGILDHHALAALGRRGEGGGLEAFA